MDTQPPTPVCIAAAMTLEAITERLGVGECRHLVDPVGVSMPMVVERLEEGRSGAVFAVGQYHRAQGGGRIWDPRVVFERRHPGEWIPVSCQDALSKFVRNRSDESTSVRHLVILCNHWLARIAAAGLTDRESRAKVPGRAAARFRTSRWSRPPRPTRRGKEG